VKLTLIAPSLVSSPAGYQGLIIPHIESQGKFATEPVFAFQLGPTNPEATEDLLLQLRRI